MNARPARPIDHCVLPVESLETARERYTALGFTMAPRADHPFGTANACIYFADNTYLEPLAVVDAELAAETALKRNVFAVRNAAYRFRNGPEGFSALVMGTANARADHRRFVYSGLSAGRQLAFSRPFTMPDGTVSEASFRLAFAADPRSPDAFFFTCERVKAPPAGRGALERHENGVTGISRVVMSEPYPAAFRLLLEELARSRQTREHAHSIDVEAANGVLSALDGNACKAQFGIDIGRERGLRLRAIVFRVGDLAAAARLLGDRGVAFDDREGRIVVQAAPGQGAVLAFEEEGQ
ncbi:MAG: VOC family protein [Rhizobiaceae bacterium]